MTFTDLVTEVMARTRQTSTEAQTRIGREINDRYRRVTSSIGLATSRRVQITGAMTASNPVVSLACEKVLAVFLATGGTRRVLNEITFDSWRNAQTWVPTVGTPTRYAIGSTIGGVVKIYLDPAPSANGTIDADVLQEAPVLSAALVPDFASSFHDILMHGALADEWMQLKQDDLSARSESMYEGRLAELRMFIAKSAYLTITQGGSDGMNRGAYWPGYFIPRR